MTREFDDPSDSLTVFPDQYPTTADRYQVERLTVQTERPWVVVDTAVPDHPIISRAEGEAEPGYRSEVAAQTRADRLNEGRS